MSEFKRSSLRKALLVSPALLALLGVWFTWMGPESAVAQMTAGHLPVHGEEGAALDEAISLPGALEVGKLPDQKFKDADALRAFYAARGNEPVWTARYGRRHYKAEQVLKVLEASWTHGLNPSKYHVERIQKLITQPGEPERAELELLVSDGLVRYARDLTGMRVDPGDYKQKARYWRQPVEAAVVLKTVSKAADPSRALRGYVPEGKFYAALRAELVKLAAQPDSDFTPLRVRGVLRPGDSHKAVKELRVRFDAPAESAEVETIYDDALAAKIMDFQRHHNIKPDGVVGPQTLAAINMTRQERINQIVANLERLRWVEQDKPDRYVLVNIPSATLWAVDDGKVALEMPVIVGKKARPTNSFKTEISGVRLNPNWTVPPTIKRQDFLPSLQEDPTTLSRKGVELYKVQNGRSVSIDPSTVDWNNISPRELHSYRMTQAPGANNPLGQVRVIMENPYNIYLHDTNHRDLFDKDERALSSGCIRVAKPQELARFLLSKNKEWSEEKMQRILASGRMTDVATDSNIPVYILYQTVWQDAHGDIVFGEDFYGQDARLIAQLGENEAFHSPAHISEASLSF